MIFALISIFFILGTIIGSFLNVVIYRYNTQRTFGGRSACMACQKQLRWYDMVPVLSYGALGGRCRNCKTKISTQYPLVEMITGFIFAGLFLKFENLFFAAPSLDFTVTFAYYATMFSLLVVIAVYDLKHKIIPDKLSLVFGVLAFLGLFFFATTNSMYGSITTFFPHIPSLFELIPGLVISIPFALLWLVSRGAWMGLGDAKLAVGLGLLLGLERILSGVVLAFWMGAIVGIALILTSKKHGMKSEIPFAPFLVVGAVVAFLFELHFFPVGL